MSQSRQSMPANGYNDYQDNYYDAGEHYEYEYEFPEDEPRISLSSKLFAIVLVVVVVGLLSFGFKIYNSLIAPKTIDPGILVTLVVEKGDGAKTVGEHLEDLGAITSSFDFVNTVVSEGKAHSIQPGSYEFKTGLEAKEIIELITQKPEDVPTFKVLIQEGLRIGQIFDRIAQAEGSTVTFDQLVEAQNKLKLPDWVPSQTIPKGGNPFEGLFWPATYEFRVNAKPEEILQTLIDTTSSKLKAVGPAKRDNLTPYQILTLASLIEREARVSEERPIISSVIYNRLEAPMRLQIDATVVYGIMAATGEYKSRLLNSDYDFKSPWSTYTNDGFPPTPISNAGLDSLKAAVNPADTKFYYYVVNNHELGTHVFAETNREHLKNVAKSQKASRDSD